jgi:hypothetical protein
MLVTRYAGKAGRHDVRDFRLRPPGASDDRAERTRQHLREHFHTGKPCGVWGPLWLDFFFTLPYYRFTIGSSADVTTAVLLLTGIAARSSRPGPGG